MVIAPGAIQKTGHDRGLHHMPPKKGHLLSRRSLEEDQQEMTLEGLSSQQMFTVNSESLSRRELT